MMYKTIYRISKMDCPSEEQMIRMKLDGIESVKELEFDIVNRKLNVIHTGTQDEIFKLLDSLKFDTHHLETNIISDYIEKVKLVDATLLWQVLSINLFFFILESSFAFVSKSMSLLADGLDMLADTLIYSLALYAVNRSLEKKKNIAKLSGYLQLALAIFGIFEVIRRFIAHDSVPDFLSMIIISILALIGNATCLYLLQKSKSKEAHMQASMIFTSNDVIVNIGVIVAGILVYYSNSLIPDLIIGSLVFVMVAMGARKILQLSK
jgi:Co/Zn/Cd efflux system component